MVTLNDGVQMPLIGYGTSDVIGTGQPGDPAFEAIKHAIRVGYRFIDTAALYLNEVSVGKAIQSCLAEGLVKREELFVCTKVWCTHHKRPSVIKSCRESLERLQLDYVDLLLIHWPVAYAEGLDPINPKDPKTGKLIYTDTHYTETWLGMEDCKQQALAKSIGVSNFNHKMTDDILAMPNLRYKPTVNQVELHPYLVQEKLAEYSQSVGIVLNAYCPLGSPGAPWLPAGQPNVIEDPVVVSLASKYRKSAAQICLRFQIQRGICPIPKSITPRRIEENLDVFDFELSHDDMAALKRLDKKLRYCLNTAGEYVDDHPLYPFHEEY